MAKTDLNGLVAEVKKRLSIDEFFTQRGLDLQPAGADRYVALCPFHHEKTPSFSISPELNRYYCFGCHETGDIFTYLEKKESMSFMDALETLCDQLNIPFVLSEQDEQKRVSRRLLMQILADTDAFFKQEYSKLTEDHKAKIEITKRGLTSNNSDHYDLFGWAPENSKRLMSYLHDKGYRDEDMAAAGAVVHSKNNGGYYPLWRGRLMFSMRNTMGKTVGFSGRAIFGDTSDHKYVNSSDNEIFHKSEVMFCEDIAKTKAREDREIYIVEGQFDVIAMQMIGKNNTVATSGTAFTSQHASLLNRFVGKDGRLIFCLDADKAGQNAELKIFQNLGEYQGKAYAVVTEDKDPSDMYRDDPEALKRQISNPIPLWEHILNWMIEKYDTNDPAQRTAFKNAVRDVYSYIADDDIADSFIRMASLKGAIPIVALTTNITKKTPKQSIEKSTEDKTATDPRNAVYSAKDKIRPKTGLDRIADNILSLALEDKRLRSDLGLVRFDDSVRERFRRFLSSNPDETVVPEDFAREEASLYVLWLSQVTQKLHKYDQPDDLRDSSELFRQQILIYRDQQAKTHLQNEIRKYLPAVSDTTSEEALRQYSENVKNLVERMNKVMENNDSLEMKHDESIEANTD